MEDILQKRIMTVALAVCVVAAMFILYKAMDRIATYEKAKTAIQNDMKVFFETHACFQKTDRSDLSTSTFEGILANPTTDGCTCDATTQKVVC